MRLTPFHLLAASAGLVSGLVLSPEVQSSLPTIAEDDSSSLNIANLEKRQAMPRPNELVDFQVYQPVLVTKASNGKNANGCVYTKTLMEYTFRNSYGAPFVGNYTPPPCSFNRVVLNLTVTSAGVQFDRLALMYLGDTEVFRTSTAEPSANGIIWTYLKEMQQWNALWRQPQTLIFDLGNIQDSQYTGAFETTLTATFFTVPEGGNNQGNSSVGASSPTADTILPISARQSSAGKGSAWQLPGANASVAYTLPRDVTRAVVGLSACGQSQEEFWYSNVPNSATTTFENGITGDLLGGGSFREVQLLIDGQLAGVSWPFPVIFTGGIVPGFWRPIVGIDAFDLKFDEIDITPWLGQLLDGKAHTFEIRVASVNDDGKGHATLNPEPLSYWLVSGAIFLFRDQAAGAAGRYTSGGKPTISSQPLSLSVSPVKTTKDSSGQNQTLTYSTTASRVISISSKLTNPNGTTSNVYWTQKLSYSNANYFTNYGTVQLTKQTTNAADTAIAANPAFSRSNIAFSRSYSYPLTVNSTFAIQNSVEYLTGTLNRGKQLLTLGNPVFPTGLQNFGNSKVSSNGGSNSGNSADVYVFNLDAGMTETVPASTVAAAAAASAGGLSGTQLNTTQVGSAGYSSAGTSYGTTEQWFSFGGVGSRGGGGSGGDAEAYSRHVRAVNSSVVLDQQSFFGQGYSAAGRQAANAGSNGPLVVQQGDGGTNVRQFLGRGPGPDMQGLNQRGSNGSTTAAAAAAAAT